VGTLSFLSPWFLAGAIAVGVPIVLHMLRRENAPPLAFSAVRFLRLAPREQQRRRHIRDIWLLLLRMLALIVLAVSFARPYIKTGQAVAAGTTVVAVDTSMSMSLPAQFARAQKAAINAISAVPTGQRVAVMAFDDRATLVSPASFDRGSARAAVSSLTPGAGGTNYAAVLGSAARVMGAAGGTLVLVSDSQQTGWTGEGALPTGVDLQIVDVSGPSENVAIAALAHDGDGVSATLTNYGLRTRTIRAALTVGDKPASLPQSVTLEAGRSTTIRFPGSVPAQGVARVHIDDAMGLAADNDRYLVLDPLPQPAVLILSQQEDGDDAFYLSEAVGAVEGARAFKADVVSVGDRNNLQPEQLKSHQVVWLLGTHGLDRRVREQLTAYVREGGALFISSGPLLDAATFASLFDEDARVHVEPPENATFPTTLAPVDTRHPIFAAFGSFAANLGHAQFKQALRIVPSDSSRVVARFTNGLPALVEQAIGNGRILTFASDVDNEWNDFPRQPTFVPFVNESLRYLSNQRERQQEMFVGGVATPAAEKPGVIRIGKPERLVAVNVDPQESRQAHITDAGFMAHVRRTDGESRNLDAIAREQESAQSWWRYGLMALAGVLVLEGLLARRPAPTPVVAAEGAKRTISTAA
jgi:Aerotolerance regulator N-terminal/von Willebrand factor type A domain